MLGLGKGRSLVLDMPEVRTFVALVCARTMRLALIILRKCGSSYSLLS